MNVAHFRRAALVITAAALVGCGEPPLGPAPAPQANLIGSLLQATGLLGCTPMPTATATQTVGPAGGVIRIGPHALSIPAGALNILSYLLSLDNLFAKNVTGKLNHFSNYAIAW